MKIIELRAQNFKRLKAVTITPDGGPLQVVAGRNAQGKTSVLDAIWWVLEQRGAKVEDPVRHGEDEAIVSLTFEDFVVTRTTVGGSGAGKLTITSRDGGAKYNSPQKMLDGLVGKLSLDPLAFFNTDSRKQLEMLLAVVDVGFDPTELAAKRKAIYDERTDVGREATKAKGMLASIPEPPAGTPDFEVSAADLAEQLRQAEEVEREFAEDQQTYYDACTRIAELTELLNQQTVRRDAALARGQQLAQQRVDPAPLQAQLREVDELNARVRLRQQREHAETEADRLAAAYEEQSKRLGALDSWKAERLAAATMPVPGLGIEEDGVTYQGVPLSQASGAERLRVSTAIAMALNPQIRVLRIPDGSLLDDEFMALLVEMAEEREYQLWIERVGTADGIGVVIEDGEVRA